MHKSSCRAIYSSSPFPAGTGCEAGTEKRHGGSTVLCPYPEYRNIDPAESAGAAEKLPADRVYAALWGMPIELDITLTQEGQTVQAGSAVFTILSECTDAEKQQVAAYLQEALGTASVREMQEEVG